MSTSPKDMFNSPSEIDASLMQPFVTSLQKAFQIMAGLNPEFSSPYRKNNSFTSWDVTGIIGFAGGKITGTVALNFSRKAALKAYQKIVGVAAKELNGEVQDLVGELANIVTGGAKKPLAGLGYTIHISLPSVVVGNNHALHHQHQSPVMVIPFQIEQQSAVMEISIKVL